MIRFIIKATFWGFLGLLILPSLVSDDTVEASASTQTDPAVTSFHAMRMANAVASDLGAVCERQPALCESGQELFEAAIARGQKGLKIASHMVTGQTTAENADATGL